MPIGTPVAFGYVASGTGTTNANVTRPGGIGDDWLIVGFLTSTLGTFSALAGFNVLASGKVGTYGQLYIVWQRAGAATGWSLTASTGHGGTFLAYPGAADPVSADATINTSGLTVSRTVSAAGSWVASAGVLTHTSTQTPGGTDTWRDVVRQVAYSSIRVNMRIQDSNGPVATGSQSRTFTGSGNLGTGSMMCVITPTAGTDHTRDVADTVGISDAVTRTVAAARSVTDTVGIGDALLHTAPGSFELFPGDPAQTSAFGGAGFTLGLRFSVHALGKWLRGVKFWAQPGAGGGLVAHVWDTTTGLVVASATFPGLPVAADQWVRVAVDTPVELVAQRVYAVGIYYPTGGPIDDGADHPGSVPPLIAGSAVYGGGDTEPTAEIASQTYHVSPVIGDQPVTGPSPGRRLLLAT